MGIESGRVAGPEALVGGEESIREGPAADLSAVGVAGEDEVATRLGVEGEEFGAVAEYDIKALRIEMASQVREFDALRVGG